MSNNLQHKTTVQNDSATVENVVEDCVNTVAKTATNQIFRNMVGLNSLGHIVEDTVKSVVQKLEEASFMTIQVALTDEQREALLKVLPEELNRAKDVYLANLKEDERTKSQVMIVEGAVKSVINESLCSIGAEVNRGAVINCTAVSADTKNKDINKVELNYPKDCGDITIPTKGVFVSTNCVDKIRNSAKVDLPAEAETTIN